MSVRSRGSHARSAVRACRGARFSPSLLVCLASGLCASSILAGVGTARAEAALQLLDPTPRTIWIEVETSVDPAVVGASFGPPLPASYSVSGGTGTIVVPVASHEQMRTGFLEPVEGTFTPVVIHIDLVTLEATSESASGVLANDPLSLGFTQNPLSSTATAGFVGPDLPPLFCASQQQVDDACAILPIYCGQTCTLVPGMGFDPATGRLNLVGDETQSGCDGASCSGPFDYYATHGDLRLREVQALPALAPTGMTLLAVALGAVGLARRAAARPHPRAAAR